MASLLYLLSNLAWHVFDNIFSLPSLLRAFILGDKKAFSMYHLMILQKRFLSEDEIIKKTARGLFFVHLTFCLIG